MTTIAAIHRNGETWYGSDTRCSRGDLCTETGSKWIRIGDYAVGIAGSLRTMNVIQNNQNRFIGISEVYDLINEIRLVLKADGFERYHQSVTTDYDQNMMVVSATGVWSIGTDFSILKINDNELWADGSGRDFALGAAYVLQNTENTNEIVIAAITAAIVYDAYSGGRITVERI